MSLKESFLPRIGMNRPHAPDVLGALDAMDALDRRVRALPGQFGADPNLSPAGRAGKLAEAVTKEVMPALAQAGRTHRRAISYAVAQKAGLVKLAEPDRNDHVGELRRQELRAFLRNEKTATRYVMAEANEGMTLAVLDAPPALSGFDEAQYNTLRDTYQAARARRLHGDRLDELDAVEADYREVEAAAIVVRNRAAAASGLSPRAFDDAMTKLEAEADAA